MTQVESDFVLRQIQTQGVKTTKIYTQVSSQEIEKIKNPLDDFYGGHSGTIHSKRENSKPPSAKHKENKHHRAVYVQ